MNELKHDTENIDTMTDLDRFNTDPTQTIVIKNGELTADITLDVTDSQKTEIKNLVARKYFSDGFVPTVTITSNSRFAFIIFAENKIETNEYGSEQLVERMSSVLSLYNHYSVTRRGKVENMNADRIKEI